MFKIVIMLILLGLIIRNWGVYDKSQLLETQKIHYQTIEIILYTIAVYLLFWS